MVTYWLRDLPEGSVKLAIADSSGFTLRTLEYAGRPGLNRTTWDLQAGEKHRFNDARRRGPVFVEPGTYTLTVTADEESMTQEIVVKPNPGWEPAEKRAELPPPDPMGEAE